MKVQPQSYTSIADLSQDKQKRIRIKSPTLSAKTKQVYLQNLEKKLDDLLTVGTVDKKNTTNLGKQGLSDPSPTSKIQLNYDYKEGNKQKKVILCQMYATLKTCNRKNCPNAHGLRELDVEYKPAEWVKIFRQVSSARGPRPQVSGAQSSRIIKTNRKELSDFSRIQTSTARTHRADIIQEHDEQVNKVINTKGRTLLIEATVINDLQSVKVLLKKGASVSQRDWLGNNSIFYAIKSSNAVMLETLLQGSYEAVNLNEQFTVSKFSYLILASKMASGKMLEILLNYGADPNMLDRYNRTALFYCVEKSFKVGVETLLNYSADINRVDTYGKTALDYAFDKKFYEILDVLIRAGGVSDDPTRNKLLLLTCAHCNLKESVHELLKRGLPPNEMDGNGNNMLMIAYESGNLELLESVLREYSLHSAINQKNKRGDNLLLRSIKDQNEIMINLLLDNPKIDISIRDENSKNLLMYAAELGDYMTTEKLINKGLSPDVVDKYGRNALIFACKNDHVLTVEVLLKYNVNPLWKDYLNKSARQYTTNKLVKGLLRFYMIENNQLSESLLKEMEEGTFNLKGMK